MLPQVFHQRKISTVNQVESSNLLDALAGLNDKIPLFIEWECFVPAKLEWSGRTHTCLILPNIFWILSSVKVSSN